AGPPETSLRLSRASTQYVCKDDECRPMGEWESVSAHPTKPPGVVVRRSGVLDVYSKSAFTVAAALAGCGDNIHNAPPPNTPGKLGSGAINASSSETVAVSTSSALSSPRYTGAIDLLGYEIGTDGSSTAACTTITMYGSNSYQSTVDSFSDLTKWFSITLTTSPPALASGVNLIPVQYPMWPWG